MNVTPPDLLASLWRASWQGAIALTVIWVVCRTLARRLPADAHCWLWRLGYVKLLVGLLWSGVILLPVLTPAPSLPPHPQITSIAIPMSAPTSSTASMSDADLSGSIATPGNSPWRSWQTLLAAAYALGVAVCLVRLLIAARRTRIALRLEIPIDAGPETACAADLAHRLGLRRAPLLARSAMVDSPVFLAGRILLSANAVYAEADLRMILAHELAHARRRDLAWEWLGIAAQIVFFFHPLVVVARREERLAREAAADALALRATDADPASYGRMLLALALEPSRPHPALAGAVGVIEGGSPLRRRLLALRDSAKRRCGRRTAVAIALLMGLALTPWQVTRGQAAPPPAIATPIESFSPPTMPKGDKSITGVVHDENGNAVAGVPVDLIWAWTNGQEGISDAGRSHTNAQGEFTFSRLPAGRFTCVVDPFAKQFVAAGANVMIGKADSTKALSITVSTGALVVGRVLDSQTQKPMVNVGVGAGPIPVGGDLSKWTSWNLPWSTFTDEHGHYEVRVKPGDVYVGVGRSENGTAANARIRPIAQQVSVQRGSTAVAPDLLASLYPEIVFLEPDGKPVGNTTIRIVPDDLAKEGSILDDHTDRLGEVALNRFQNGSFSIGQDGRIASGSFHWSPGNPLVITMNGQNSNYPSGVGTVSLSNGSAATVALSVVSEDGKPIPNALVRIEEMDSKSRSIVDNQLFKADASGVFHAPLDPNGEYYIYLRADGFNQVAVDPKQIVLKKGATTNLGAISLLRADGFVSGRVVDDSGKPMAGLLTWVQGRKTGVSAAMTDAQGRFRIPNVVEYEPLRLNICLKGESSDSGQALSQSNEMMEIPGIQASSTEREIVWKPEK